jgi:hypothetical protein
MRSSTSRTERVRTWQRSEVTWTSTAAGLYPGRLAVTRNVPDRFHGPSKVGSRGRYLCDHSPLPSMTTVAPQRGRPPPSRISPTMDAMLRKSQRVEGSLGTRAGACEVASAPGPGGSRRCCDATAVELAADERDLSAPAGSRQAASIAKPTNARSLDECRARRPAGRRRSNGTWPTP